MAIIESRWGLLIAYLITDILAQGLAVINGQIFGAGLAIYNSPQPNTPMGGGEYFPSVPVQEPDPEQIHCTSPLMSPATAD